MQPKKTKRTKLTKEQSDVLHQAFTLFDTDKSGAIDESELRNAMKVFNAVIKGARVQCFQGGGAEDGRTDRSRRLREHRVSGVRGDDEKEDAGR